MLPELFEGFPYFYYFKSNLNNFSSFPLPMVPFPAQHLFNHFQGAPGKLGNDLAITIFQLFPDFSQFSCVIGLHPEKGEKSGLKVEKGAEVWEGKLNGKTIFEIHHGSGDAFKILAELYTPDGYFVKCSDAPSPSLTDPAGKEINMGGFVISNNYFQGCRIGIWIKKDGLRLCTK